MSDTNQAVQPQKIARGLKYRIEEVQVLYYPCSDNKGTGQLRGYCGDDLRFCFRIILVLRKMPVFSSRGSIKMTYLQRYIKFSLIFLNDLNRLN